MDTPVARSNPVREKWLLVSLLFLLLCVGCGLILTTIEQAPFNTVFLLTFVSVAGLVLCRNTQVQLTDPALKILGYLWLIKLGLTLFLLYAGWMPQLDLSSASWGYDPQRYYIQAQQLIDNNWSSSIFNLNYVGILYYYGGIYYVFGHNPIIPALINAFVTLIGSLYLVKVGYEIKGQKGPRDWTLAFALLLPELLWFDVMTSRESLTAVLLLFSMLTTGRYFVYMTSVSLAKVLVVVGLSMLAIVAVRSSMLLPVVTSIALMALLINQRGVSRLGKKIILVASASTALIFMTVITGYLGGSDFDVAEKIQISISASQNIASSNLMRWSENSIGMLLLPEGLIQALLFLPPRMVLYLVSPLPNIFVSGSDLLAGSWGAWQKLFTLFSSVINVLMIPYALASFVHSIQLRKTNSAPLVFHISYWVAFMAIAGGNLIIHERYRVMASLLLCGCAWLGSTTCSKNLIKKSSFCWYGFLAMSAAFYLSYKAGLL